MTRFDVRRLLVMKGLQKPPWQAEAAPMKEEEDARRLVNKQGETAGSKRGGKASTGRLGGAEMDGLITGASKGCLGQHNSCSTANDH